MPTAAWEKEGIISEIYFFFPPPPRFFPKMACLGAISALPPSTPFHTKPHTRPSTKKQDGIKLAEIFLLHYTNYFAVFHISARILKEHVLQKKPTFVDKENIVSKWTKNKPFQGLAACHAGLFEMEKLAAIRLIVQLLPPPPADEREWGRRKKYCAGGGGRRRRRNCTYSFPLLSFIFSRKTAIDVMETDCL